MGKKRKKFYVSITETLQKTVCVMAYDEEDAKDRVESAYQANKIVLNADDYLDDSTYVEVEGDQEQYESMADDSQMIQMINK